MNIVGLGNFVPVHLLISTLWLFLFFMHILTINITDITKILVRFESISDLSVYSAWYYTPSQNYFRTG